MHPGQGPGLSLHDLGEVGGSETVTLLSSEMPMHSHGFSMSLRPADNLDPAGRSLGTGNNVYAPAANLVSSNANDLPLQGGNAPHNNMMPYLTCYFCIALQGVFPPRS